MQAYKETLEWLYSSPDGVKAYAAWSGLPDSLAKRAPEFIKIDNLDPGRISGLDEMMTDAIKFKYLPSPLSKEQLKTLVQLPAAIK